MNPLRKSILFFLIGIFCFVLPSNGSLDSGNCKEYLGKIHELKVISPFSETEIKISLDIVTSLEVDVRAEISQMDYLFLEKGKETLDKGNDRKVIKFSIDIGPRRDTKYPLKIGIYLRGCSSYAIKIPVNIMADSSELFDLELPKINALSPRVVRIKPGVDLYLNLEMEAYGRPRENAFWFKAVSADGKYIAELPDTGAYVTEASSEPIPTETNAANSNISYSSIRSKITIDKSSESRRGDYCASYAQEITNGHGIGDLQYIICCKVVDDVTDFGSVRNVMIFGINARELSNTWYNDTYTLFKGQISVSSNFRDMIEIVAVGWPTPYMRLYKLSADGDEIHVKPDFLYEYLSDRVLKLAVNENTAGQYRVDVGYLAPLESKRFQVKLIEMPQFNYYKVVNGSATVEQIRRSNL